MNIVSEKVVWAIINDLWFIDFPTQLYYVRDVITKGMARVSMVIITSCIVKHSVALLNATVT